MKFRFKTVDRLSLFKLKNDFGSQAKFLRHAIPTLVCDVKGREAG